MSDPREAMAQLFAEHRAEPAMNSIGCSCAAERWDRFAGYAAHLADVIAREFLVVPRSEITATEYGWRERPGDQVCPRGDRDGALLTARKRGGEAVERPALPWSPIVPEVPDA